MSAQASSLLKTTLSIILGPHWSLARLFHNFKGSQDDLESQEGGHQSLTNDNQSTLHVSQKANDSRWTVDGRDDTNWSIEQREEDLEIDPELPGPSDGPSRVFVHRDGTEPCLGLLVTAEMVEFTQSVIDSTQVLRKHQKIYECIEQEILSAQNTIAQINENLTRAEQDELQKLRLDMDIQESTVQDAYKRRDKLAKRLKIFEMNLDHAMQHLHCYMANILESANLLDLPKEDNQNQPRPEAQGPDNGSSQENNDPDPEEEHREAARNEVIRLLQDRGDAEREFDSHREVYYEKLCEYKEILDSENLPDDRSTFDRLFVQYGQRVTRDLIDADEAYKQARLHAIEIGAVESDWGESEVGGPLGQWEEQSLPYDELVAIQADRDWGKVEVWIDHQPPSENPGPDSGNDGEAAMKSRFLDTESPVLKGTVEIDDWDARPDEIWESVSAYDSTESSREKIDRWETIRQESRAHLGTRTQLC